MLVQIAILFFINSVFILGLANASKREYILGIILRTINLNKFIQDVFFSCVTCMPTVWGTSFYTFYVLYFTDSVFLLWFIPVYDICLSFISHTLALLQQSITIYVAKHG